MMAEPPVRTDVQSAKLWLTVAMALYVAWITVELFLPLAFRVHFDERYVVSGALSVGTRGALAAALRSFAFLLVDRLAPPPTRPATPPST